MSFGYIPDFRGVSISKDMYVRIFGYPYAPRRNEARLVFKLLGPHERKSILDIGSGDGVWTNELAKKGCSVAGLDIRHRDVATGYSRAKKLGANSQYIVGDAQKLPFANEVFDQCFSICVLEHIRNDDEVFREVHRVLKAGGAFVLSVPSDRLPYSMKIIAKLPRRFKQLFASEILVNSRNDDELRRHFDMKFKHVRRYDKKSLALKAREAGFTISRITYNLKVFGGLVNGIIHSLRVFDLDKQSNYRLRGNIWHAIFFPFFYALHRLDDLLPLTGCTIVVKLYKD